MSDDGYTPQQVTAAAERLKTGDYSGVKSLNNRTLQPQVDREILAWAYLNSHAEVVNALARLADASESFAGSDPDSAGYRHDEAEYDAALDNARLVLGNIKGG